MYHVVLSKIFEKRLALFVNQNKALEDKISNALDSLASDPTNPSLKSHKVNSKDFGMVWSSRVTGDLRLLWIYDSKIKLVIIALTLGTHTDKYKVYK
jgi:mRNA-degrading endonuclease YafQ of YafQ-DinJ toxin-antitoxin module